MSTPTQIRRLSSTAGAMRAMGGLIGELQATCFRSSAVERGAHNALAAGSNPAGSTNYSRRDGANFGETQ